MIERVRWSGVTFRRLDSDDRGMVLIERIHDTLLSDAGQRLWVSESMLDAADDPC